MHCLAVEGATLILLRSALAGGPLQARPLLRSLSALVTRGSISLRPSETEIGKLQRVELRDVHFPPAIGWLAESLGGEPENNNDDEFRVHEEEGNMEDEGEGAQARACAIPIPISALSAPGPSSTRCSKCALGWLVVASTSASCIVASFAGSDDKETTRRATRCADACAPPLL